MNVDHNLSIGDELLVLVVVDSASELTVLGFDIVFMFVNKFDDPGSILLPIVLID